MGASENNQNKELERVNEEWLMIFNAISDPIFILDKDNVITKANKAFFSFSKTEPNEVIGKKCYELLHKLDKTFPGCPFEETAADKLPHTEEINDPNIGIPLLITTSPIFNDRGEFAGAVHIAKDISQLKAFEEELKRKVESLERFQRVTVGRELKMKELKARISELEQKQGLK